jgi:hypothetical protein
VEEIFQNSLKPPETPSASSANPVLISQGFRENQCAFGSIEAALRTQGYRRKRGNTPHNPSTEKSQDIALAAPTQMIPYPELPF